MTSTRTRATVVSQRVGLVPTGGVSLHCIGDLHAGANETLALVRRNHVVADMGNRLLPTPAARLQLGDMTNDGTGAQDTLVQAFFAGLPDAPIYAAVGNHDLWSNVRTPAQWATAYGLPAANYTADIGDLRLIVLAPDAMAADNTVITLSAATVTWLDGQLSATSKDCLIACHAPLYNTVTGDASLVYSSTSDGGSFSVNAGSDATLRAVLAAHPNAKAWISGHTHSPIWAPGLVTALTLGGRPFACINTSALAFTGRAYKQLEDPIDGLFVTHYGDRIEVRFRHHGAGVWDAPDVARVLTVNL